MIIWKKRIIDLLELSCISRSEFAKGINKSQSAINQMLDPEKNKSLNSNTLIEICQFFNISSDYILGLTDDMSNDYELVSIGKKLGLKAAAIQSIVSIMEDENRREAINEILCTYPANNNLLKTISDYFLYYPECLERITISSSNEISKKNRVVLDQAKGEIVEQLYLKQIEDILIKTKRQSYSWNKKRQAEEKRIKDMRARIYERDYQMSKEEMNALEMQLFLAEEDLKDKM